MGESHTGGEGRGGGGGGQRACWSVAGGGRWARRWGLLGQVILTIPALPEQLSNDTGAAHVECGLCIAACIQRNGVQTIHGRATGSSWNAKGGTIQGGLMRVGVAPWRGGPG